MKEHIYLSLEHLVIDAVVDNSEEPLPDRKGSGSLSHNEVSDWE